MAEGDATGWIPIFLRNVLFHSAMAIAQLLWQGQPENHQCPTMFEFHRHHDQPLVPLFERSWAGTRCQFRTLPKTRAGRTSSNAFDRCHIDSQIRLPANHRKCSYVASPDHYHICWYDGGISWIFNPYPMVSNFVMDCSMKLRPLSRFELRRSLV